MGLHINGKDIPLREFNSESISKGSISNSWDRYSSGDEKITFDKKGAELKAILYVKKYQLEGKIGRAHV